VEAKPTVRQVWLAFVIAGVRSKFGAAALLLMLAIDTWEFVRGKVYVGLIVLAVVAFTYARIPSAIGAAIAVRQRERKKSPQGE